MRGEVIHELLVDDGVVESCDDGEEGDWAEVARKLDVVVFGEGDEFGDLYDIWVVVFVNGGVEFFVNDWGDGWCEG